MGTHEQFRCAQCCHNCQSSAFQGFWGRRALHEWMAVIINLWVQTWLDLMAVDVQHLLLWLWALVSLVHLLYTWLIVFIDLLTIIFQHDWWCMLVHSTMHVYHRWVVVILWGKTIPLIGINMLSQGISFFNLTYKALSLWVRQLIIFVFIIQKMAEFKQPVEKWKYGRP